MAHNKCSGLLCLFLDRLGGLAGLFCGAGGIPGSLTGALGSGIFLFNGLFLLPAGDGIAGELGIFSQRFLVHGRLHLAFSSFCSACAALRYGSSCGCGSFPDQPRTGFNSFLGLVGALHATLSCSVSRISLWSFPSAASPGASRTAWDSLEGGFFLSSSTSLVVTLPVLGSTVFCRTCFLGIFACALSALTAARSALRIGFSSAGSARSSSVKCRRGSLRIPATRHQVIQQHTGFRIYRNLNGFCWKDRCGQEKRHQVPLAMSRS
mgnify:CR=1 FL=1